MLDFLSLLLIPLAGHERHCNKCLTFLQQYNLELSPRIDVLKCAKFKPDPGEPHLFKIPVRSFFIWCLWVQSFTLLSVAELPQLTCMRAGVA